MEVILLKEVHNLGNAGDITKVKAGYAQNYLLPQKLAVKKSIQSLKILEKQKEEFAKINAEKSAHYTSLAQKLQELNEVEIFVKTGQEEKLYGTVTPAHIAAAVTEKTGIDIDKRQIILREHIKHLGAFPVTVKLGKEHKSEIIIKVSPVTEE